MAINRLEVDDVRKHSAWFFELLLRVFLPAQGCHRSADASPEAGREDAATPVPLRVSPKHSGLLCGEDVPLIRPYVLASEELRQRRERQERQERRLQRGRRRALWLAVHGVDAGAHWNHGVQVVS
ncbi:hypothetical protein [Streptomyces sp. S186]|uniref:hypothetical protein n=1 Tax=Streptomyces sp. S186 TaxID=3434395 RepID=UPI003F679149